MFIDKIELENIKKYENIEINFNEGINFISGKNGAGKTTLIESIGFALFDFQISQKNFADYFIKKGKKKATVRLYFRDKNDNKLIIDRKISFNNAQNSWSIRKVENEIELAVVSGNTEVKEYLRQNLEFYDDDDITSVYKNIVSVPQGEFTFAFLQSEAVRKTIFDPIFKLEGFKDAYSNIKLEKGLIEEIIKENENIAEKKGATADFDNLKVDLKAKSEEEKKILEDLKKLEEGFLINSKKLEELESLRKEIEKHNDNIKSKKATLEKNEELAKYKQIELVSAKDSKEKMMIFEKDYESYKILEKELEAFEVNLKKIENEKRKIEETTNRIEKGYITIEAENKNLLLNKEKLEKLDKQIELAEEKIKKQSENISNANILSIEDVYDKVVEGVSEFERAKTEILKLLKGTIDTKEISLLNEANSKIKEVKSNVEACDKSRLEIAIKNIDNVILLKQNLEDGKKEEMDMLIKIRDDIEDNLKKIYKKYINKYIDEEKIEIVDIKKDFKRLKEENDNQKISSSSSKIIINEIMSQMETDKNERQETVVRCEKIKADIKRYEGAILDLKKQVEDGKEIFEKYNELVKEIDLKKDSLKSKKDGYETFIANKKKAEDILRLQDEIEKLLKEREIIIKDIKAYEVEFEKIAKQSNEEDYINLKYSVQKEETQIIVLKQNISFKQIEIKELKNKIDMMDKIKDKIKESKERIEKLKKVVEVVKKLRNVLKDASVEIADILIRSISDKASEIYSEISVDGSMLEWKNSYELVLHNYENGEDAEKEFKQLSGGEQMTAALSVRIAMIELITRLKLCILDEPTINLDSSRREKLSEIIENSAKYFRQLIVVSHDDTFETITQNIIELK